MIALSLLLEHSLRYGVILSVVMSLVILISLYLRPQIWIDDAPADIRAAAGPISASDRRLRMSIGIPTLLFVVGLLAHALLRLAQRQGGALTFFDATFSTFLIIQTFNLVDLLIIDWLIVVALRPSFIFLPGTEHLPGYNDYRFHFHAFLKGVLGSLIASPLIAGIACGLAAFVHF